MPDPTLPPLRLEWRTKDEIAGNPRNWRTHPATQRSAMETVFQEVGWAGALLYNETTGRLIDGHMRKDLPGQDLFPVLVGAWTEEQEKIILASLDPLGALALPDQGKLDELMAGLTASDPLKEALALLGPQGEEPKAGGNFALGSKPLKELPPMTWVLLGIPTIEYGLIDFQVQQLAQRPGVVCEIAMGSGERK